MSATAFLTITKISASQAQKEVTANDAFDILDKAIAGGLAKSITSADVTLSTDEARNAAILLSGTLTGNRNLIVPAVSKIYLVKNGTSGSYTVTVKTPSGTGVVVTQGKQALLYCDGTNVIEAQSPPATTNTVALIVPCSDESTAIAAGTSKVTFRMPFAMTTVTAVRASLTVAQSSGSIFTVDINEAGASILSTKLTIDNTEKTSVTAATPAVISDSALADDAEITIDVDQIGDGTAKGLKVTIIGTV